MEINTTPEIPMIEIGCYRFQGRVLGKIKTPNPATIVVIAESMMELL